MIEHIRSRAGHMMKKGLKLAAVTAATLYDGRGVLKLRWHNNPASTAPQEAARAGQFPPVPFVESSLPLDQSPPAAVERAMLVAAGQFGAREVSRIERSPLALNASPYALAAGLVAAFAETYGMKESALRHEDFPEDARVLIERAANEGWIMWLFRPACGSALLGFSDAPTLTPETRMPRNFRLAPFVDCDHYHVYRLAHTARQRSYHLAGASRHINFQSASGVNKRAPVR